MAASTSTSGPSSRAPANGSSPRSLRRQEQILDVALQMFAERGYEGTGIDDIGRVLDMSGTALYRHFENKEAILVRAIDLATVEFRNAFSRSRRLPPAHALEVLLRMHATVAVKRGECLIVWYRSQHYLPEYYLKDAGNLRRDYLQWFIHVVTELRPDLPPEHCREVANATMSMLDGVPNHRSDLAVEDRIDFLVDRARDVIIGWGPGTGTLSNQLHRA